MDWLDRDEVNWRGWNAHMHTPTEITKTTELTNTWWWLIEGEIDWN